MITQNGHINIRNGNFDICMKCVLMLLNYSVQTLLFEHNHNKIFEDLEKKFKYVFVCACIPPVYSSHRSPNRVSKP